MEGNQHLYHQSEEQLLNEKNIVLKKNIMPYFKI